MKQRERKERGKEWQKSWKAERSREWRGRNIECQQCTFVVPLLRHVSHDVCKWASSGQLFFEILLTSLPRMAAPKSLIRGTNRYARAPMWRLSDHAIAAGQKDRGAPVSLLFICVVSYTTITGNISPLCTHKNRKVYLKIFLFFLYANSQNS